ncbi:hypothetical protein [Streptomyces spinosus]|uniref:hypothetical protein n=1 Tax=Streptomyces spinosus TaxID=2872623 RepID=UPI001CEDF84D|nr:hypothetical protein [Streptomyces spinosus]
MAGTAVAALVLSLAGCSGDNVVPSEAPSAVKSAASEAANRLRDIRNGIVATDDAKIQEIHVDNSGHAVARVIVTNSGKDTDSYAVQVNFNGKHGDLVDAVVVTLPSVRPGSTARAEARSHRELPDKTTAEVVKAVRY